MITYTQAVERANAELKVILDVLQRRFADVPSVKIDDTEPHGVITDFSGLSAKGHFAYVSHDEAGVTVEVGLPDRDPYKEVTLFFGANVDDVERLLMLAIRECEEAEEALVVPAPEPVKTPNISAIMRNLVLDFEVVGDHAKADSDLGMLVYSASYNEIDEIDVRVHPVGWPEMSVKFSYRGDSTPKRNECNHELALDHLALKIARQTLRDRGDRAPAPPAPKVEPPAPKVEIEFVFVYEGGCLIENGEAKAKRLAADGFNVAGYGDGLLIMQRINEVKP